MYKVNGGGEFDRKGVTRRGSYFWLSLLSYDLARGHPSPTPRRTLLPPGHPPLPISSSFACLVSVSSSSPSVSLLALRRQQQQQQREIKRRAGCEDVPLIACRVYFATGKKRSK